MDTTNRADGLDRRIMNSIKYHAGRLAGAGAVPGMEATDYEQDLVLDLLHRQKSFRPELSAFRTFADRLIRNRICSITSSTHRMKAERAWVPLDAPVTDHDGTQRALVEVLPAETGALDIGLGLQIDFRRFLNGLCSELRDVCQVLLADSVVEGARHAGISRSTAYARTARLREHAVAVGLDLYLKPDIFEVAPVCDRGELSLCTPARDRARETPMPASLAFVPSRSTTERDFCQWLDNAACGSLVEYHRGNLAMHIGAQGHDSEVARLGRRARLAAERRLVHLVQLRHGHDDYSYLAVMRPKDCASENTISMSEVAS